MLTQFQPISWIRNIFGRIRKYKFFIYHGIPVGGADQGVQWAGQDCGGESSGRQWGPTGPPPGPRHRTARPGWWWRPPRGAPALHSPSPPRSSPGSSWARTGSQSAPSLHWAVSKHLISNTNSNTQPTQTKPCPSILATPPLISYSLSF